MAHSKQSSSTAGSVFRSKLLPSLLWVVTPRTATPSPTPWQKPQILRSFTRVAEIQCDIMLNHWNMWLYQTSLHMAMALVVHTVLLGSVFLWTLQFSPTNHHSTNAVLPDCYNQVRERLKIRPKERKEGKKKEKEGKNTHPHSILKLKKE